MTDPLASERSGSIEANALVQLRNPWIVGMFKTSAVFFGVALVVDLISVLSLVRPTEGYVFLSLYVALGPISSYCWIVGTVLALSAAVISAVRWRSR